MSFTLIWMKAYFEVFFEMQTNEYVFLKTLKHIEMIMLYTYFLNHQRERKCGKKKRITAVREHGVNC